MKVDASNWLILKELQQNARIPLSEIAKKVSMSAPAVSERIQKMEDAGIIKGYSAELDMNKLGYNLGVIISIKIRFGQVAAFEKFLQGVPEIQECLKLTGNDCMLMRGYVRNTQHLDELNVRLTEYGELTTSLVLNSIIQERIYDEAF
ncbi:MAG: Lrp/AsnC family transcriptional regulator [Saprospiraceae bacterium]|nr:Lrp/AsnC family transcriptional regulator [Saprospiraceae bacterium]